MRVETANENNSVRWDRLDRILSLFANGSSGREVAALEKVSLGRIYQLRKQALRKFARKHRLSVEQAQSVVFAPQKGAARKSNLADYSQGSANPESVARLSRWRQVAHEVITAQDEWERVGLSDLRAIMDHGPTPPFVPLNAWKSSGSRSPWRNWRMDGWGDWFDEAGQRVARGGRKGLETLPGKVAHFTGDFSSIHFRCQFLVGFPVVIDGKVISFASDRTEAVSTLDEFAFNIGVRKFRKLARKFGLRDDIEWADGSGVSVPDPGWQMLIDRSGAWVAGPAWIALFANHEWTMRWRSV